MPLRNANVEMASSDSSENGRDLNNLIYRFDTDNPWTYFASGATLASSVERGRKKRNPKLKKMYVGKRRKVTARKNRPHKDIARMPLICSCNGGCLMKLGASETRELIRRLRQTIFQKSYDEQNYILLRLIEVKVCPSGIRRVSYKIPSLGTVCRGAFEKCYGFSKAKIRVLLNKMDAENVSVQQDMRGRHGNNAFKLLPNARKAVIDYICSYNASESHYRREKSAKRYFDSHLSMRRMWRDFIAKTLILRQRVHINRINATL